MNRIILSAIAVAALGFSAVPSDAASSGGPVASPPIIIVGPIPGGPKGPEHPHPIGPTRAPGPIQPGGPIIPAPGPIVSPFSGL